MLEDDTKKIIQQGFDTVASGYDHPALAFFPQTAKSMMSFLQLQPDDNLLDVCTGTGVVALAAAPLLAQGSVTGIDLSSGMLAQAKKKARVLNYNNTHFMQMDLDKLAFSKGEFDVACSSFGLFFLKDMTHALHNISNVVKSKGKIAISTFTGDAFMPMSELFVECYASFGKEVPGGLSWKRLSTHELIRAQFAAVGLTQVEIHHVPLGYQMTDVNMWWDVVWNAGYRALLNQLNAQQQAEFKKKHLADIERLIDEDGIWFNTEVLIAVAQKD